jgi:hypothetical protein
MNHLLTLAVACSLSLLASPHTAHAQSEAPAAPPAAAGSPPVPATLAPLKLDTVVVNPEDLLDTQKTLLVPTLYLTLLTDGKVTAVKQSGLLSGGNATARASAAYRVAGLDKAYVQELARAAYEDFVAQLRQAGYTVLDYAAVKDRDVIRHAAREKSAGPMGLPASSEGSNNFVTATPSDEQHFASGMAGGAFSEFISGGKNRFSDATVVIPHFMFQAPQAWAQGGEGYKRVSAEANVAEGMNMINARAHWLGQPKTRMMRGIPGVATKAMVINVTEKAGSIAKTADSTPQAANALSTVFSMFGAGQVQRSSGEYLLTIDRDAFRAGVLHGVRSFNAEVAKAAAAALP